MDVSKLWADAAKNGKFIDAGLAGASAKWREIHSPADAGAELCPYCRRNARVFCPHKPLMAVRAELAPQLSKQEMFGPSPPNLFVGDYGYPNINIGPLVCLGSGVPDNPRDWYGWNFAQIVRARSMQVRGRKEMHVLAPQSSPGMGREANSSRMLYDMQETAMSIRQVDMEVKFTRKPTLQVEFNAIHQPMGASAPLQSMRVTDNPKIPKKVDSLIMEGAKATEAVSALGKAGFDEYYITKLLCAGVLGQSFRKKIVPTRWSITATDDMIAKQMMETLRDMKQNSNFLLYSNEYLANKFDVLVLPGAWEYEGFEAWIGPSGTYAISEEHEPHWGRKNYASRQGGGYYAARLGVCEGLLRILKRQARVVVFREILPEYDLPVGVWEIRENVRHAFRNQPEKFASLTEALNHLSSARLKLPLASYLSKSEMLGQTRLGDF